MINPKLAAFLADKLHASTPSMASEEKLRIQAILREGLDQKLPDNAKHPLEDIFFGYVEDWAKRSKY